MINNKYLGAFKTDQEYDHRECVVLTYAIPLNKDFTNFDYENSLVVDLRSVSQSTADYLRDLCQSADALSFKTFMQFASTRKYQSRDEDILTHLHRNGYIRKVPANCVLMKFSTPERGEYTVSVAEINKLIQEQLGVVAGTTEVSNEKWDASDFTNTDSSTLVEVKEEAPYVERVVREEKTEGTSRQDNTVPNNPNVSLKEEVLELRKQLSELAAEVERLKSKPKAGRPKKEA